MTGCPVHPLPDHGSFGPLPTGEVMPPPMNVFQMRPSFLGGGPRPYSRRVSSPRYVDTFTPSPSASMGGGGSSETGPGNAAVTSVMLSGRGRALCPSPPPAAVSRPES